MADEWDNYESTGKSFGRGNYIGEASSDDAQKQDDNAWHDGDTVENNGWNDDNNGSGTNDFTDDRGREGYRGRGRGRGGRGGRGNWGDRGDRRGNDEGGSNRFGDDNGGDDYSHRKGRGHGNWGDRGDRRGNDEGGNNRFGDDNGGDDYSHRKGRGHGNWGDRGDRRGNDEGGSNRFGDDNGGDEDYSQRRGGGRGGGRGGRGGRGRGRDGSGGDGDRGRRDPNDEQSANEKPREFYIPPEPTDNEEEIFDSGISSGINFDKYDKIAVNVSAGAPPAITSFEESGLKEFVLENVRKSKYEKPTPIQKNAIPIIMAKKDLMACAQTGSGKTAAFLLPIINDLLTKNEDVHIGKPQALIFSPTRELSIQIYNEARKFALGSYLKITIVYGGTAVKHQGDNIAKGCHILVCTPGRLMDFVDRSFISFEDIRFVVLDEADRMLDLGFMPVIEKIMTNPTMPPPGERQTIMVSATFPEEIQRIAGQFLQKYIFLAVGIVGGACADVEQNFFQVSKFEKRNKLMEILELNESGGTMVFVETKRNADFLASLLSETKFPTTSIHGDRFQREREQAIKDFKSGKMSVLIATSVAARGLDIKNVAHVINYDLPKSIDEYVHRIGRTGRVGNCGKATSFYDPDQDADLAQQLVRILKQADKAVPDFLDFAESSGSYGASKKFGGRDVRNNRGGVEVGERGEIFSQPAPLEPEEEW